MGCHVCTLGKIYFWPCWQHISQHVTNMLVLTMIWLAGYGIVALPLIVSSHCIVTSHPSAFRHCILFIDPLIELTCLIVTSHLLCCHGMSLPLVMPALFGLWCHCVASCHCHIPHTSCHHILLFSLCISPYHHVLSHCVLFR